MKKILVSVVVLGIATALCGCKSSPSTIDGLYDEENGRFSVEYKQTIRSFENVAIIVDTETGCRYLWVEGYESGGLCKLEN